jgi:sugar lactone lactonase YvrE
MTERTVTPLLDGGAFFETPRWHEGRWWVSDFYREAVYTVTPDGTEELLLAVEHQPAGLGWMPDGSLLVVSMKDQRVLRRAVDGTVTTHADLSRFTDSSLNDMVVDARGRAWVGCFGFDLMALADPRTAPLMRVDPDGSATVVAEDLLFPNGSVITPDGSTLIVGETAGCRYTAFTIEEDGTLTGRRPWTARWRTRSRRSWSDPTAARWTPRVTSGRPTRQRRAASGSRPAARSSTRSRCPRA